MARHDGSVGLDDATLSALVDGELAPEESRKVLERVAGDARLQAQWARYHAVRAACGGATRANLRPGFSERVRNALADEPTVVAPKGRWWRPTLRKRSHNGLAFAASVALLTFGGAVVVQWEDGPTTDGTSIVAEGGAAKPVPLTTASSGMSLEGDHRMAVYLARHSEYAGAGDMPDLVPYSRLTSFNAAAR